MRISITSRLSQIGHWLAVGTQFTELPPLTIIGIPRKFDVVKRPLTAAAIGRSQTAEAFVEAGLELEFHEPGGGFRLAARCCCDLSDDAAVCPMVVRIGNRRRVFQITVLLDQVADVVESTALDAITRKISLARFAYQAISKAGR